MCARHRMRKNIWMKSVNRQAAKPASNWRRLISGAMAIAVVCLLGTATASAQMAEDVFKNVQVLKGIPVDQFMDTMGFFSAALGLNCTGCHVAESLQDLSKFAEDVPRKRMARNMIRMVDGMNKANF